MAEADKTQVLSNMVQKQMSLLDRLIENFDNLDRRLKKLEGRAS